MGPGCVVTALFIAVAALFALYAWNVFFQDLCGTRENPLTNAKNTVLSFLKRLDLVIAAIAFGFALAPISSSYLCAEASCRSVPDTIRFYGLGVLATLGAGAALWRLRHWALRICALVVSLYATYVVPEWTLRHGNWIVRFDSGECVIEAGAEPNEVRDRCGLPSYVCSGPKHVDSSMWNPLAIVVCGYEADVYADRVVEYDCEGRVAEVTGFDTGPSGNLRPVHCVTWKYVSGSR